MEINGLVKESQYWMQFRKPKQGVKVNKKSPESSYDYYYEYYVVFVMNRAIYDKQLDAALNGIENNASETEMLKKALSVSLRAPLLDKMKEEGVEYTFGD